MEKLNYSKKDPLGCFQKLRFDVLITNAFLIVKDNIQEMFKLTFLPMSLSFVISQTVIPNTFSKFNNGTDVGNSYFSLVALTIVCVLSNYFTYAVMVKAVSNIILKREWDTASIYRDFFSSPIGELCGTVGMFFTIFLLGPFLILLTGQGIFLIPSLIAGGFLVFFLPFSVLKKIYYKDALGESYELVRSEWKQVFTYYPLSICLFGFALVAVSVIVLKGTSLLFSSPGIQGSVFTMLSFLITVFFGLAEHTFHVIFFFSVRASKENYSPEDLRKELLTKGSEQESA